MEYVINRQVRTGDRLTKSVSMAGYPRAFATEAGAMADYATPRAKGEMHRMLRWFGDKPGEFKVLRQQTFK
jgi:hypothetical protein